MMGREFPAERMDVEEKVKLKKMVPRRFAIRLSDVLKHGPSE